METRNIKKNNKITNFILYLIFLTLSIPFRIVSYTIAQKLGYFITVLFFKTFKRYPKIIHNNLEFAFPEKDSDFYKNIYKKNIIFTGKLLADTFCKFKMDSNWFQKRILKNQETLTIEKEIENKIKNKEPVILISGHLGSWENLAQYLGFRFYPNTAIIYKSIKNPYVDKWFYKARSKTGAKLFSMEDSLSAIKFLQEGKLLAIAPDQNAGSAGILIDFLNRPASTYKGPAFIGLLSKAHLYFVTLLHNDKANMQLIYKYIGKIEEDSKNQKEKYIKIWTAKWVKTLEAFIKQYPEQYFWVHQRWKTTPEIMKKFTEEKMRKRGLIK